MFPVIPSAHSFRALYYKEPVQLERQGKEHTEDGIPEMRVDKGISKDGQDLDWDLNRRAAVYIHYFLASFGRYQVIVAKEYSHLDQGEVRQRNRSVSFGACSCQETHGLTSIFGVSTLYQLSTVRIKRNSEHTCFFQGCSHLPTRCFASSYMIFCHIQVSRKKTTSTLWFLLLVFSSLWGTLSSAGA